MTGFGEITTILKASIMIKNLFIHKTENKQVSSACTKQFFEEDGHLNDAGISLYTEALLLKREDDLPSELLEHVASCPRCQHEIYEFYQWMESEKDQIPNPHPFLDQTFKPKTIHRVIGWTSHFGKVAAIILLTVVTSLAYLIVQQPDRQESAAIESPFENQDINVSFREWNLNNDYLRVLYLPNGGSIHIPAHSFINEQGKAVSGDIQLLYREFASTSDIIASGIPMVYDSAGQSQNLQTCGMFEIRAFQQGIPLEIAPNKNIEVKMASKHYENDFFHYNWQETEAPLALDDLPFVSPARAANPQSQWKWVGKPSLALANYIAEQNKRLLKDKEERLDSLGKAILDTQEAIQSYQKRAEKAEKVIPQNAPSSFTLNLNTEEYPGLNKHSEKIWEYAGESKAESPTIKNYWTLNEKWDQLELSPLKYKPLSLKGHAAPVNTAYFSPDGALIITASSDYTAKVWSNQAQYLYTLSGHRRAVNSARFSPNGAYILTASDDHSAKIWLRSGQFVTTLVGHQQAVLSADFSPNGQYILTSALDHTAKLWNAHGQMLHSFPHQSQLCAPIFSPDNKHVLTIASDSTAQLWSTNGKLVTTVFGDFNSIAFFPDSKRFVTTSANALRGRAAMWDIKGNRLKTFGLNDASAFLSPDGQHLISHSNHKARLWYLNPAKFYNAVLIRNMNDLAEEDRKGHQKDISSFNFSPNGKWMITASHDQSVKIWNEQGWIVHTLREHTNRVNTAVFSPNGHQVLTASDDYTAKLWVERSVKDVYEMTLTKKEKIFKDEKGHLVKIEGQKFYTIVRPVKPGDVKEIIIKPNPKNNPIDDLIKRYEHLQAEKKIIETKMVPVKATWLQTFHIQKLGIHSSARLYHPNAQTNCTMQLDWPGAIRGANAQLFQIAGNTFPVVKEYTYTVDEPLDISFDPTVDNTWLLVLPHDRIASFSTDDLSTANWEAIRQNQLLKLSLKVRPSLTSKKEFDDILRDL